MSSPTQKNVPFEVDLRPQPSRVEERVRDGMYLDKVKTIFLFHFLTGSKERLFKLDTEFYCNKWGIEFPYNVQYVTVTVPTNVNSHKKEIMKLRQDILQLSELNPKTNQILFFVNFARYTDQKVLLAKQMNFLKLLEMLNIENISVFFNFSANNVTSSIFSLKTLEQYKLKKGLNTYLQDGTPGTIYYDFSNLGDIIQVRSLLTLGTKLHRYGGKTNLVCQPWFEYFSNYAFGCIKGRLRQLSGTCYLNSVVNAIILTPTLRKAALDSMKAQNKADYSKPINLNVCERKTRQYFFRLLYNIFCSQVPIKLNEDIIVEFSKLYSDNPDTGQGGHSDKPMIDFLDAFIPGMYLLYTNPYRNSKFFFPETEKINNEWYDLQCSVIYFEHDKGLHAVVGFICDGVEKIYDSNNNILDIPWTGRAALHNELKDNLSRFYGGRLGSELTAYLRSVVYVKRSLIEHYRHITEDELCARL
jgi:hypothetical protein